MLFACFALLGASEGAGKSESSNYRHETKGGHGHSRISHAKRYPCPKRKLKLTNNEIIHHMAILHRILIVNYADWWQIRFVK